MTTAVGAVVLLSLSLALALRPTLPITTKELVSGQSPHSCGLDLMKQAARHAMKNNKATNNKANDPTTRDTLDPRFKFPSSDVLAVDVCSRTNEELFRPKSDECFQMDVTNTYASVENWPTATIKLKVISYSDGYGNYLLTEEDARTMVANINSVYNTFGINYVLTYESVVNTNAFYGVALDMNSPDPFTKLTDSVGIPNLAKDRDYVYALVTHIAPLGFAGLCAPNPDQSAVGWGQVCFLDPDPQYILHKTPAHELGHSLGLYHPFQNVAVATEKADPYPSPQPDGLLWINGANCGDHPQVFSFNSNTWTQSGDYYTFGNVANSQISNIHICRSAKLDATCLNLTEAIDCAGRCVVSREIQSYVTATCPGINSAISHCPSRSSDCVIEYDDSSCSDSDGNFRIVSSPSADIQCGSVCQSSGSKWYTRFCGSIFPKGASYSCASDTTGGCLPEVSDFRTGDLIADTPVGPNYQELSRAFDSSTCQAKNTTVPQCINNGKMQGFVAESLTESATLIMSYFPDQCQTGFSPGQIGRLRCGLDRYLGSVEANVLVTTERAPPPVPAKRACRHNGGGILVEWTPTLDLLFPNEDSLNAPSGLKYVVTREPAWNTTATKQVNGTIYALLDNEFSSGEHYRYWVHATNNHGTGAKASMNLTVDESCKSSYSCPTSTCLLVGPDRGGYDDPNSGGPSAWTIIGIVVGCVAGISVVLSCVVGFARRRGGAFAKGGLLSAPLRSTV